MSPLVPASPFMARRDPLSDSGPPSDRGPLPASGPLSDRGLPLTGLFLTGLFLTKRRPIDFGLVATCLCRPA
jgi:hypothetical protein